MKTALLPSVQGKMGDWTYYTTIMKFADVVSYVKFAEEIAPWDDLDQMLQREITSNAKQITNYLQTNEQRFFGSIIVAAYGGTPKFLPIKLDSLSLVDDLIDKVGILKFDGSEKYYVLDGQHRLAAMREAVAKSPDRYQHDEISVIVVCHNQDQEGYRRARRLFTTINRYAKKTSTTTNIVMDEDDGIAIITRRLIREVPFFRHRIKIINKTKDGSKTLAKGEAMGKADSQYLMAIGNLYLCVDGLLPGELRNQLNAPQQLPEFDVLERSYEQFNIRWNELCKYIPLWENLTNSEITFETSRTKTGGDILARPAGVVSFVTAVGKALDQGITFEKIGEIANRFVDVSSHPWRGLFWNETANKMVVSKERIDLAIDIWEYFFGMDKNYLELDAKWRAFSDPQNQTDEHLIVLNN